MSAEEELDTASRPQSVRPEDGERPILPDGCTIRLKVRPAATCAGCLFIGAVEPCFQFIGRSVTDSPP